MASINFSLLQPSLQWVESVQEAMPKLSPDSIDKIYAVAMLKKEEFSKLAQEKGNGVTLLDPSIPRRILFRTDGSFFVLATHPNQDKCLGKGAYKHFWKAVDQDGGYAALGISLEDADSITELEEELKNLMLVKDCEYFVKILDHGKLGTREGVFPDYLPTILLEYCNLGNLREVFTNKKYVDFPLWRETLYHDLFSALIWLHERGYVHRDVKPANILCSEKEGVLRFKLADLSPMCRFDKKEENKEKLLKRVTTAWYASPELTAAMKIDKKHREIDILLTTTDPVNPMLDMWSAGCCLLEALILRPLPWIEKSGEYHPTLLLSYIHQHDLVITPAPSETSPFFLLQHLLEPKPEKRISARQCIEDFPFIDWRGPLVPLQLVWRGDPSVHDGSSCG